MKTKNIFKSLAFAMLMPAMLLTTACSNDNDIINDNNEPTAKESYKIPVTVNVTRQGDATRATYNDGTKKLGFSTGDKLLVNGQDDSDGGAGQFAGILDYDDVSGKFSGTITTENAYTGTADALFTAAYSSNGVYALLLPAGYEEYGFLEIDGTGYEVREIQNTTYTFATSKAAAVEQFSCECTELYSDGFALAPMNAIVNFTITGLPANTDVDVSLTGYYTITRTVTTDSDGKAVFGAGVDSYSSCIDLIGLFLTVGGNDIALSSTSKILESGTIYNITRAAPALAPKTLAEATTDDIGKIAGKDGNIYATKAAAEAVATGNAVAMIAYVGTASDCAHGLAIALADESGTKNYGAAGTACSGKAAVTGGTWRLPSDKDWQYMFIGCGSSESYSAPTHAMSKSYSGLASKLTTAQGAALQSDFYWSSTEDDPNGAWGVVFNGSNATFYMDDETCEHQVRACLAF